jgi:hypothetical protein
VPPDRGSEGELVTRDPWAPPFPQPPGSADAATAAEAAIQAKQDKAAPKKKGKK